MATSSPSPSPAFQTVMSYGSQERKAVICLAVASLMSLLAVLYLFASRILQRTTYNNTHIYGYFVSLLVANAVQSMGTVMNFRWSVKDGVVLDSFCMAQGAIKQAGNVGTALWSFVIAVHLFNLLFLRWKTSKWGFIFALACGWYAVIAVVTLLPLALQRAEKGPYFGISGAWCWITWQYPREQIFLEYFWEFVSAGLGFILYSAVLLRVRGNLVHHNGEWSLRWVPRSQSWQLAVGRDLVDSSVLKVAQNMVWYPVAYTIILIPITIARLMTFSGKSVPYGVTIFADIIFNSTGFVNVMLLLGTRRFFPEMATLPLATPRKHVSELLTKSGVTPFLVYRSETAEKYMDERPVITPPPQAHHSTAWRHNTESSISTIESVDSKTAFLARNCIG